MEKRIIIEGEMIHHVGYRPFLLTVALKFKKITNFEAENILEEERQKVIVYMIGEEQSLLKFVKFIKNNFPDYAKNCRLVSEEDKITTEIASIYDFRDILSVEQQNNIVQGGLQISSKIDTLIEKTDTGFGKMDDNFKGLDKKYDKISKAMFEIVEKIEERNKIFEDRIEKTEKNIESLLNILVQQKKD